MTPVAASNGTLNPAATGGTHATKRRRSILHRAAYCSGPGSTDRQPACPFATILRLDLSRLLGFVDISPLHPLAHVGIEALDPSQSLPPHEATGVMLMSDTCVHRPSSRWIVAPCPISAGYRLGYLLNNTSSEQLLAKEKYMLRRQQHSDLGAFSSDFRSRQHGRSSSWSPQYPVLTKRPEPECKAGLDLTSGNTTFRALRHTSSWTVLVVREATGKVIQATTHSARPPKDSVKVETPGESGTWCFSMLEARSGKSFTSAWTSRWSSQTLEDH